MKRKIVIMIGSILVFVSFRQAASAQNRTGVKFEQGLSWEQVRLKARKEHKYIFLDCYASWCGPCKHMDAETYPNDTLGRLLNDRFISVKVQFDSTKQDDNNKKAWYKVAHDLVKQYQIKAFPTFLFFAPDGKIVHRGVGYLNPAEMTSLAMDALDPHHQYYTLLNKYRQGNIDPYLFSKKNILLLSASAENSKDTPFQVLYKHADQVDAVTWKGYSRGVIDRIVSAEEIYPRLKEAGASADWDRITTAITRKYNKALAERLVIQAKEIHYFNHKVWKKLFATYIERYEKYGVNEGSGAAANIDGVTNNMAWLIFEQSDDPEVISKAAEWQLKIINEGDDKNPTYEWMMDTYANLLYKAGRKADALRIETEALRKVEARQSDDKDFKKERQAMHDTISKMEKGDPTW